MNTFRSGFRSTDTGGHKKIVFTQPVCVMDGCMNRWRVITDGANLDPMIQLALAAHDKYIEQYEAEGIVQWCRQHDTCFSIIEVCPKGRMTFEEGEETELYAGFADGLVKKGWAREV